MEKPLRGFFYFHLRYVSSNIPRILGKARKGLEGWKLAHAFRNEMYMVAIEKQTPLHLRVLSMIWLIAILACLSNAWVHFRKIAFASAGRRQPAWRRIRTIIQVSLDAKRSWMQVQPTLARCHAPPARAGVDRCPERLPQWRVGRRLG